MTRKRASIVGVLTAAAIATTGAYAYQGQSGEQDEAAALAQAKITLSQAIAAAERHVVGGKASSAEIEDENGKIVYGVEIVGGGKSTDVKVDIATGQILSAQADTADHERGEEGHERR